MKRLMFALTMLLSSIARAELTLSTDRIEFPDTPVANVAYAEVIFKNDTPNTITITDIYATKYQGRIYIFAGGTTIYPGSSIEWAIAFKPATKRTYASQLIIEGVDVDTAKPFSQAVELEGYGY